MQDQRVLGVFGAFVLTGTTMIYQAEAVLAADLSGADSGYAQTEFRSPVPRPFQRYVRGDIGIGHFSGPEFSQQDLSANGGSFLQESIDDTVYIGAGIGVYVGPRLRVELTGEYRSTADIKAMDNLTAELVAPDGELQANTTYDGNLRSYVGLVNGYWDLFHARGFTPYIGAGVGLAHNVVSDITTVSAASFTDAAGNLTTELSSGTSKSNSETNFAWALMAGTSYDISSNAKLDLGYRYLNLGSGISASSDRLDCTCGTVGEPLQLADLESHEIRIGIRWALGGPSYTENSPFK